MSWHWVRKDRQPPGDPSYPLGTGSALGSKDGGWLPWKGGGNIVEDLV